MAIDESRQFRPIAIALLTVSDTRGPDEDTSGDILAERIQSAGHTLADRAIEKDDADVLERRFNRWIDDPAIDAIVSTGGALPKIMAAYNAGLTPVTRWNSEVNDQGDPLL